MEYELSATEADNARYGKAFANIKTEDTHQRFETLFRVNGEFGDDGLKGAFTVVQNRLAAIDSISVHPTLLVQLTLVYLGAELVFHRDDPQTHKDMKFHRTVFHFPQMMDAIAKLARGEEDDLKPSSQFKHPPLKGLWHKHVSDVSISGMATNLLNEWNKEDWLEGKLKEILGPLNGTQKFDADHANAIAHLAVEESFKNRSARSALTGEWVVFSKHEGVLHLLTLGSHEEDDSRILDRFRQS